MSASKEIIGHIDCPICKHEMPVKADKNGHAYGHCAHRCNAQVFTRNDHRDSLLRQNMRPVSVTVTASQAPAAAPVTAPAPVPAVPAPAPAKPAQAAPPKPAPVAPPKVKAAWFSPVLGGAK